VFAAACGCRQLEGLAAAGEAVGSVRAVVLGVRWLREKQGNHCKRHAPYGATYAIHAGCAGRGRRLCMCCGSALNATHAVYN
jgi:hypothetical protein